MEELVAGLLRPRLFPFGKLSKAKPAAQWGSPHPHFYNSVCWFLGGIARRHSTYVIIPKRPKFRKKIFGKIKKEEFARRFFKKTVYFRV